MEQFVQNLLHAAAWTFAFIFLFALIFLMSRVGHHR